MPENTYYADVYLRLSKEDGDKEESDSIANQRSLILDYLKSQPDIQLHKIRIDDGRSGVDFNRPAFIEMIDDIKAGVVNCVIVKDFSRFGRNYIEAGKYIQVMFPRSGVRFIAINDAYDSSKAQGYTGNIIVPFKNMVNDAYCADISVKVRSHLDMKRKKGDFVGAFAVYGYPNPDNHYFSCGKYREGLCGKTHHIRVDVLDRLLLAAIDNAVCFARDFEDEFVKIVVSEKYRQIQLAQRQNQRKLDAAKKREQELDILFSRIYEDNALGKLPDIQYQKLLVKYQEEYDNLLEHIKHLETVVKEEQSNEMEVNNFLKVVQRYTRVNQITPAILREFIHHIVVHHRKTVGKVTEQKVEIHFNFIGEVNLPDVEQRHKLLKTFGKEKREQTA